MQSYRTFLLGWDRNWGWVWGRSRVWGPSEPDLGMGFGAKSGAGSGPGIRSSAGSGADTGSGAEV